MKTIKGFKNVNVILENEGIKKTSILIENGKIAAIGDNINEEGLIELPENLIVSPGFIDEHTHGSNGSDAMNAKYEDLANIASSIPAEGTTSFLFTTMTMGKDKILDALTTINGYLANPKNDAAKPLGVHLEGPFISKEFKGAQNEEDILPLNINDLKDFFLASGNSIKEMTYSYQDGHDDFISLAKEYGISLSLGHTNDTCELAKKAFSKGTHIATHMFNAMKGIHHRDIGTAGAALLDDNVSCELIADLHHVSPDAVRLLYKCKGKEGITLITDSMEAKYLPDGEYQLGGNPVYVKDGTARLIDGTLAGSILKLNEGVRNIKNVLGIPLEDAVYMASVNPAKNLGVYDKIGSISVGKDADFVIIDNDVNVYSTISKGEIIFKKEGIL